MEQNIVDKITTYLRESSETNSTTDDSEIIEQWGSGNPKLKTDILHLMGSHFNVSCRVMPLSKVTDLNYSIRMWGNLHPFMNGIIENSSAHSVFGLMKDKRTGKWTIECFQNGYKWKTMNIRFIKMNANSYDDLCKKFLIWLNKNRDGINHLIQNDLNRA